MAELRILSASGDRTLDWDNAKVQAGDPEALAAVREAERIFQEHRRRGATAFRVEPGRPAERLEAFDPRAERVIVVPRVAGGADDLRVLEA